MLRTIALAGARTPTVPGSSRAGISQKRETGLLGLIARAACVPVALGAVVALAIVWSDRHEAPARATVAAAPSSFNHLARIALKPPARPKPTPDLSMFQEDYNPDQARITWARRILESPEEALREDNAMLRFGPMRVPRELAATIVRAARATQTDPSLLMAIADKESSFAPTVQARTSSATGLFQFIETTWLRVMRDFGGNYGHARQAQLIQGPDDRPYIEDPADRRKVLELRNDPYLSAVLAAEMLKRDAARIEARVGRPLSDGEIYLAHFLGPSDAERFIAKLVEQPKFAAQKLLPKPARANRPIFFHGSGRRAKSLSVADVHRKFEDMIDMRSDRYKDVAKVTGATAYADDR